MRDVEKKTISPVRQLISGPRLDTAIYKSQKKSVAYVEPAEREWTHVSIYAENWWQESELKEEAFVSFWVEKNIERNGLDIFLFFIFGFKEKS